MDNETFRCPNCCNSAREESLLKSTKTIFLTLAILQNSMSMQLSDYVTSGTLQQRPIALVGCHQGNEHKKQVQVQEPACFFLFFFYQGVILITGPSYSPEVFSYSNVHDCKVLLLCLSSQKGISPPKRVWPYMWVYLLVYLLADNFLHTKGKHYKI